MIQTHSLCFWLLFLPQRLSNDPYILGQGMQWDAWITSVYFSSPVLEEGNAEEHFIGIISSFMHTWPSVICFGRHHRNHIIQFTFLQVFNVFYLFSLGKEFNLYLKILSMDKYFFKPLQKTNSLYSNASASFICRQLGDSGTGENTRFCSKTLQYCSGVNTAHPYAGWCSRCSDLNTCKIRLNDAANSSLLRVLTLIDESLL